MTAPGYKLDPEALKSAIGDLIDIRSSVYALLRDSVRLSPGELRAGDIYTQNAHKAFKELALNNKNSLWAELNKIRELLEERIKDYQESLEEYLKAEENASIDAGKIQRES